MIVDPSRILRLLRVANGAPIATTDIAGVLEAKRGTVAKCLRRMRHDGLVDCVVMPGERGRRFKAWVAG